MGVELVLKESTIQDTKGSLKISESVIYKIAKAAALEINGVESIADSIDDNKRSVLRQIQKEKGISVLINNDVASIKIRINVESGAKVTEVAKKVQKNIKQYVQNLAGIAVSRVDVYIAGVTFAEA